MIVTKIETVARTKYKIFIDEQFAFVLYKGELSRYNLAEGEGVAEEVLTRIREEVLLKRAKLRCMHLLKDSDKTEYQLTLKLRQGYYPEDIIEQAIAYVKSFGYLNDEGYAQRYVSNRKEYKSKKEIYMELKKKGMGKITIEQIIADEYEGQDEREAIKAILTKRRYDPETASPEEKRKVYAYLSRKGFSYDDIRSVMQVSEGSA